MIARLFAIFALVLVNAFFVAAEFSLVRSRRTRLEAMTRGGDALARLALRATSNISRLLPAIQLGVTFASLGIGWLSAMILNELFLGALDGILGFASSSIRYTLSGALALALVAYLHVVFGELVPKAMALNRAERLARLLVPPLLVFAWFVTPLTWLVKQSARLLLKWIGEADARMEETVHSPEELRILVEQSHEVGNLPTQDADMIDAVLDFSEKTVVDVMTPRTELVALPVDATLDEVLATVEESGMSRYPVYEETIDDVIGLVLAKDLLRVVVAHSGKATQPPAEFTLRSILRPAHVVPGSREVEDVLADFKRLKEHMAIVLDEYGGTAGVVTMEDLLEEIVGEILDEYDEPEVVSPPTRSGETVVPGSTHIGELNERFALTVPDAEYTTIGGFVFGTLGRLPTVGDHVTAGGAVFTVSAMDGRRIDSLAVDLHSAGDRRSTERVISAPVPPAP